MKIFLVVMAVWSMAYRDDQITPSLVQEMPSRAACEAVASAIRDMGMKNNRTEPRVKCVEAPAN